MRFRGTRGCSTLSSSVPEHLNSQSRRIEEELCEGQQAGSGKRQEPPVSLSPEGLHSGSVSRPPGDQLQAGWKLPLSELHTRQWRTGRLEVEAETVLQTAGLQAVLSLRQERQGQRCLPSCHEEVSVLGSGDCSHSINPKVCPEAAASTPSWSSVC